MRLDASRLSKIRRSLWITLTIVVVTFIGFSIASGINYTEVSYAKLSVDASADLSMSASNVGLSGEILNETDFSFSITANITNPSLRSVRLQLIQYQCSIRDYIFDDRIGANESSKSYYTIFVKRSIYNEYDGLITEENVRTYNILWQFNITSDSDKFSLSKEILNYALSSHGLTWQDAEWNHYFFFKLIIIDVPSQYYGPNSGYLIELPVIDRDYRIISE